MKLEPNVIKFRLKSLVIVGLYILNKIILDKFYVTKHTMKFQFYTVNIL
jgi:hypothetical protein